jgi:hypothetical protein
MSTETAPRKAVQVDAVVMPDFGQKVTVREKYTRKQETRTDNPGGYPKTWKVWKRAPFHAQGCVFLGVRTLKNGIRHFDGEEGYYFQAKEHIKAALVSPGPRSAPILVPLESIEA